MYGDVYLWSTLLAAPGQDSRHGDEMSKWRKSGMPIVKATMNALYLMVAAVAKDATTAIVMSSPFMPPGWCSYHDQPGVFFHATRVSGFHQTW